MIRSYIFEKGNGMPLCALDGDIYFDCFTGEVITNQKIINFINEGIKKKLMKARAVDLIIYEIVNSNSNLVFYNMNMNRIDNYLSLKKQPLNTGTAQTVFHKLMTKEYKQVKIWE